MSGVKIISGEIKNLYDLEKGLSEIYEVEIDAFQNMDYERFFFNPFILNKINNNPFKLNERNYPVDLGAPSETNSFVQIKFPENFVIQSLPEKVGVFLPGDGGRFLSEVNLENSMITMQQVILFKKSKYGADEYFYLKELYNKIIQTQKFDVVFKKKI